MATPATPATPTTPPPTPKPDVTINWGLSKAVNGDEKELWQVRKTRKNDYVTWLFQTNNRIHYDGSQSRRLRYFIPVMGIVSFIYGFYKLDCSIDESRRSIDREYKATRKQKETMDTQFNAGYTRAGTDWQATLGLPLMTIRDRYGDMLKVMEYDRKVKEDAEAMNKLRAGVAKMFPPSA